VRMKAKNFLPATYVQGLAFGATFPEEQREHPIACLGSYAGVSGGRLVVCLDQLVDKRGLSLNGWGGSWGRNWRFLGVQEIAGG
jgi:hypothetical protein